VRTRHFQKNQRNPSKKTANGLEVISCDALGGTPDRIVTYTVSEHESRPRARSCATEIPPSVQPRKWWWACPLFQRAERNTHVTRRELAYTDDK
jgi:hypothetical protein